MRPTLTLLAAALLTACSTPSLQPLYTDDTIVYDGRYTGTWQDSDANTFDVSAADGPRYRVRYIPANPDPDQDHAPVEFLATLVDIDGERWLDLHPAKPERDRVAERYANLFVPAHVLARLTEDNDALRVELLRTDWINDHADELGVGHATSDGRAVITSGPASLQEMVRRLRDHPEAFAEPYTLRRQPTGDAQ